MERHRLCLSQASVGADRNGPMSNIVPAGQFIPGESGRGACFTPGSDGKLTRYAGRIIRQKSLITTGSYITAMETPMADREANQRELHS